MLNTNMEKDKKEKKKIDVLIIRVILTERYRQGERQR